MTSFHPKYSFKDVLVNLFVSGVEDQGSKEHLLILNSVLIIVTTQQCHTATICQKCNWLMDYGDVTCGDEGAI